MLRRSGFWNGSRGKKMDMTTADDLVRAAASVHPGERIPVRRHGTVPRMADEGPAPVAGRPSRMRSVLGAACWLLLLALAIGLIVRFGR
jgi:hypothetical protein